MTPHDKPILAASTTDQTTTNKGNSTMDSQANQANEAPRNICLTALGQPLSRHGAFDDMEESARILSMSANALKGIGAMLLPSTNAANEQISATRMEASEIFSLFGEIIDQHIGVINDAAFRIAQAADGHLI